MYERFSDRARKAMQLANQEAQRLNHEAIQAEHIFLGILKEGSGVSAIALKTMGLDLDRLRRDVATLLGSRPDKVTMGMLPLTEQAKQVIQLAKDEANELAHNYVGTEHLLLGLVRQAPGFYFRLGIWPDTIRATIDDLLNVQKWARTADEWRKKSSKPFIKIGSTWVRRDQIAAVGANERFGLVNVQHILQVGLTSGLLLELGTRDNKAEVEAEVERVANELNRGGEVAESNRDRCHAWSVQAYAAEDGTQEKVPGPGGAAEPQGRPVAGE